MPKIKVNDIRMFYEVHGEGFPLIMIMGFTGTQVGGTLAGFKRSPRNLR